MTKKLKLLVPSALVAGLLSFAPIVAQETADPNAGAVRTTETVSTEDGPNPGWFGLLGLLGLAGLIRRNNHEHHHDSPDVTRTTVGR